MRINLTTNDIEELIASIELIHEKQSKISIDKCKKTFEGRSCWYVYMKNKLSSAMDSKANSKENK